MIIVIALYSFQSTFMSIMASKWNKCHCLHFTGQETLLRRLKELIMIIKLLSGAATPIPQSL